MISYSKCVFVRVVTTYKHAHTHAHSHTGLPYKDRSVFPCRCCKRNRSAGNTYPHRLHTAVNTVNNRWIFKPCSNLLYSIINN